MSIPTFNSTALVSGAARDLPGSPEVRLHAEALPGVNGRYVQRHGSGARKIIVRGVLEASGANPAVAHQNLKTSLRAKQDLADGNTLASYVGTDGQTYTNCMLTEYRAAGDVQVSPAGSGHRALVFVEATILQLTP